MTVLTSGAAGNLREQILSAAASCFRERGIKATTMQEIAKRAGISVGNFYNYFDGKDAIIDEFAQREVARLACEIDEIVNGRVSPGGAATTVSRVFAQTVGSATRACQN